jgi:hypothetical protein
MKKNFIFTICTFLILIFVFFVNTVFAKSFSIINGLNEQVRLAMVTKDEPKKLCTLEPLSKFELDKTPATIIVIFSNDSYVIKTLPGRFLNKAFWKITNWTKAAAKVKQATNKLLNFDLDKFIKKWKGEIPKLGPGKKPPSDNTT